MNPIPSPSLIDIIIHESDAEWWKIGAAVGPIVVILGVVLYAAIVWFRPWDLKTKAGSQSDWWARARWALEASLEDDPKRREVGLTALQLLNESTLSGKEETSIIAEAWRNPLREARSMNPLSEKMPADRIDPKEERVVIRAARLRLSTDKKQGIESPSWVKEIAQRPL